VIPAVQATSGAQPFWRTMGDQALVQLAGKHRDAVHPGVMTKLWQVMQTLRLRLLSSIPSSR
jgi:hypothetical protein